MKLQQIGPILLILLAFTATARAAEAVKQVTIYRIFSEADNGDQAALNRLHGLAQEGNATGEFCLGDYLWNKKKQYVDAIAWFRKAAKNGNGWGEFSLGVAYSSMGHGVPKSNITALKWWYIAESHRDDADMAARNDARIVRQKMTPPQVLAARRQAKEYINNQWKALGITESEIHLLKGTGMSPLYVRRLSADKNNSALLLFYHALGVENQTAAEKLTNKIHDYCHTHSIGLYGSMLARNPYRIEGKCFMVSGVVQQTLWRNYGLFSSFGKVDNAIIEFKKPLTKTDMPGTHKYLSAYVVGRSPTKYQDILGAARIVPTLYVLHAYVHKPFTPFGAGLRHPLGWGD